MTREQHEKACRQLFEPLGIERFFAEVWPSRFFHDPPRPERLAALDELLGRSDLDSLLAVHEPAGPAFVFSEREGTMTVDQVPTPKAKEGFSAGSLLLKKMHKALPSVGDCVRMIERICGLPVDGELCDSHIHLSTAGAGFMTHLDDKDIVMLQLRGTKAWWVDEVPFIESPTDGYVPGDPPNKDLKPYWPSHLPPDGSYVREESELCRIDLAPGSLLFIPRGFLHRTKAVDESVTLTFGFHTRPWVELVLEKLKHKLVEDVDWRRPVHGIAPSSVASRAGDARAAVEPLLRKLLAAARDLTPGDLVDRGEAGAAQRR
jgi:ribosomal protein L16 Arg81 hydroxylase